MAGKVLTGCRVRVMLGGKKVGYVQGLQINEEVQYQPIEACDNIEVEENVPIGYTVGGSMQKVRIVGASVKQEGYFPSTGKTPAEHLLNILNQGVLTLVAEDNKTGLAIMTLQEVKIASNNTSVSARGVVGVDVAFVAKRKRDEFDAV